MELGDWKDNRVFRLMAVDQGEMIFHDTIFDKSKTFMLCTAIIILKGWIKQLRLKASDL